MSLVFDLDYTISVADADHLISFFQLIKEIKVYAGSFDYYKLYGQSNQFASAKWQVNSFSTEYKEGGGAVECAIGANSKVKAQLTFPVYIPRGRKNVKVRIELDTMNKMFEIGGATLALNSLTVDIYARYENQDNSPIGQIRRGKFLIEESQYDGSPSHKENIFFKDGYVLSDLIIYVEDITTANLRANSLAWNFDKLILEHNGENIIDILQSAVETLAFEIGLTQDEFRKTLSDKDTTDEIPCIFFFSLDDIKCNPNTRLRMEYNSSMASTDLVHVIKFYTEA